MNCLVTGGAGFIGSHLCERLIKEGHKVVCFDDLSTGTLKNLKSFENNSNFVFVKGDANNLESLKKLFTKYRFDYVFHYAAVVGVERTLQNPLSVLNDVFGIRNILELSKRTGVKKAVFASSSEVYGEPVEIPEVEEGHVNAKLPYAVTKLIGENFFKAYYAEHGLNTCCLRFFNVYGPRQDSSKYGFVTGIFIKQLLNNEAPTIFGDGTQTRDFVYVEDNINASIKALESEKTNGQVVNIGTGRPMTILDLAETLIKITGKKIDPRFIETRRDDVRHRFPDVSKMRALLDYRPKYSLEEGLKKTMEWYKEGLKL